MAGYYDKRKKTGHNRGSVVQTDGAFERRGNKLSAWTSSGSTARNKRVISLAFLCLTTHAAEDFTRIRENFTPRISPDFLALGRARREERREEEKKIYIYGVAGVRATPKILHTEDKR